MKKVRNCIIIGLYAGACVFVLSGCGANQQKELLTKIDLLDKEVMRLRAEKSNLNSRNVALDDKVVVLEQKLDERQQDTLSKKLKVITLSPPEDKQTVEYQSEDQWEKVPKDTKDRLVLELSGSHRYSSSSSSHISSNTSSEISSKIKGGSSASSTIRPPSTFRPSEATPGGDNLGVVNSGSNGSNQIKQKDDMSLFQIAYRAYSNKQYDIALADFAAFLAKNSTHRYADNAMFWRGECYLAQGKLLKAVGEFERLLRRYSKSEKNPSTLYRLGFIYDKLNDKKRAKKYYFQVVEQHQGTDAAHKASQRMAAFQAKSGGVNLVSASAQR